jgi:hypothetical protein
VDALTAFTTTSSSGPPTITTATTFKVEDVGMIVSEALAAFYGLLLLLQGSIELAIETRGISILDGGIIEESYDTDNNNDNVERNDNLFGTEQNNDSTNHYVDESSSGSSVDFAIRKMARAIIVFTPATNVQLVSEDLKVFYSFGSSSSSSVDDERQQRDSNSEDYNDEERKRLITLALDTISTNSRGGKFIALPSDHPSSKLIPYILARRCVLVQKMDNHHPSVLPLGVGESSGSRTCLIIGSDNLLQSYTKNDLRWIGQLAEYGNLMMMDSKVKVK